MKVLPGCNHIFILVNVIIVFQSLIGTNYVWIAPIETIVVVALLWVHLSLGASSLIGLAVIILLIPLQLGMGKIFDKYR